MKKKYTPEEIEQMNKERKEKLHQAFTILDEGVKNVWESGRYAEYLRFMSRFHTYSFGNQMLIMMQNPEANLVAGFKAWQDMERRVIKGQNGIKILAPNPVKFTKTIVNDDGEEEEEEVRYLKFKVVYVYGDNQTEGKEIPSICHDLESNVDKADAIRKKLEEISEVPVTYEPIYDGSHGYFSPSQKRIVIKSGMSEAQTIKTLVHELAHSIMHCEGGEEEKATRDTKEVQAESVAFVVTNYLGIDSSDYSFGYVAGWAGDKEAKQLRASLDIIQKTAEKIISRIEKVVA